MPRLIIIAGAAGVGKSTVRQLLAERLGFASVGPDDFPGRWRDVYPRLDHQDCVLECCKIPRAVRERLSGRELVVELVAPAEVRAERLREQGHDKLTVARRVLQAGGSLGYQDEITPDLVLDTSGSPGTLVDRIEGALV